MFICLSPLMKKSCEEVVGHFRRCWLLLVSYLEESRFGALTSEIWWKKVIKSASNFKQQGQKTLHCRGLMKAASLRKITSFFPSFILKIFQATKNSQWKNKSYFIEYNDTHNLINSFLYFPGTETDPIFPNQQKLH